MVLQDPLEVLELQEALGPLELLGLVDQAELQVPLEVLVQQDQVVRLELLGLVDLVDRRELLG